MRRLEFVQGTSSKFWEVDVDGCVVTTRWGRIGTDGQSKSKEHATPAKAQADADKQAHKKLAKGYGEGGTATTVPSPSGPQSGNLQNGQSTVVPGSSGRTYTIQNTGGVYDCTCPAWRHQSLPIDKRTCKHIRALRGEAAETARLGTLPAKAAPTGAKSTAPRVLLAMSWADQDPTDWWMSEKLDGVRAWWDGERFWSRLGNEYFAPDWFKAKLPKEPLDGELFGGRGRFQDTVGIVKRMDGGAAWREIAYVIFDAPTQQGPFAERLAWAHALELGSHAHVLEHERCTGTDHLRNELAGVEAMGGEGLMLRKPGSAYVAGRSDTLLKVKTFHDAEAVVTGHQPGTGRHRGRMGALLVKLPDGTPFKVGTGFTDAERDDPPSIGTTITFRYQELTRAGVPRFPSYLRDRDD
jgi:DNA ligase-1